MRLIQFFIFSLVGTVVGLTALFIILHQVGFLVVADQLSDQHLHHRTPSQTASITSHYPAARNDSLVTLKNRLPSNEDCRLLEKNEFEALAQEVLGSYFPELAGLKIGYRPHDISEFLLKTNISVSSVFRSGNKRQYWVEYHPRLLECAPVELDALKGILVHEFFHIKDYSEKSTPKLLAWLIGIFLNKKKFFEYERHTDRRSVVIKKQGAPLILWRQYSNGMFPPDILDIKGKRYLTIEEIVQIMGTNADPVSTVLGSRK